MRVSKPRKHSKTFTGCWTCRTRKIKCDEQRPVCMQCLSKNLECGGYGLRLHWLTPDHGSAISQDTRDLSHVRSQRSRIPFEPHRCALSDDQIDKILASIDGIDVASHAKISESQETVIINNFGVFDVYQPSFVPPKHDELTTDQEFFHHTAFPGIASHADELAQLAADPSPSETSFSCDSGLSNLLDPLWYANEEGAAFEENHPISPVLSQRSTESNEKSPPRFCTRDEITSSQRNVLRVDSRHFRWREPNGNIIFNPSPAYLPPLEQFLMHHYAYRVVRLFCVIDNIKSPWQRIHLKRTLQSTGQMNVAGSTTRIQHALRNALLSISAFTLSNDSTSRGHQDEATRWANEAMIFRGKAFKLLKDSVERGFQHNSSPKYKDYLATMLSMISINVMSGDTSTCGVHLDGAFHFMKCARDWKVAYSFKARSLHRIYFYLRTIYESTITRKKEDSSSQSSPTSLMIPELSEPGPTDQVNTSSHTSAFIQSPESDCTRLGYECIYGVPHYLLVLLEKTTNLILVLVEAREKHGPTMIPNDLSVQCDKLEGNIIDWPLETELDKYLLGDTSPSAMIIRHTSRAFHNALIIYFAQHVRFVSYRYLHTHIGCVLDCIEVIEKIKLESDCFAAPLYWPAFIAASEAFDDGFQRRFRKWYEQVEMYGIAAVRTGISILTQIWKNGPDVGYQSTSKWRMEVERTSSVLMLS